MADNVLTASQQLIHDHAVETGEIVEFTDGDSLNDKLIDMEMVYGKEKMEQILRAVLAEQSGS